MPLGQHSPVPDTRLTRSRPSSGYRLSITLPYPQPTTCAVLDTLGNRNLMPENLGSPWWLTWAYWAVGLRFSSSPMESPLSLTLEKLRQRLDERPCVQHVVLDSTNHLDLVSIVGLVSRGWGVSFRPPLCEKVDDSVPCPVFD